MQKVKEAFGVPGEDIDVRRFVYPPSVIYVAMQHHPKPPFAPPLTRLGLHQLAAATAALQDFDRDSSGFIELVKASDVTRTRVGVCYLDHCCQLLSCVSRSLTFSAGRVPSTGESAGHRAHNQVRV